MNLPRAFTIGHWVILVYFALLATLTLLVIVRQKVAGQSSSNRFAMLVSSALIIVTVLVITSDLQLASAAPADAQVTRKNVAVSFAGMREDSDGLWVDSCIKLPSNKDWLPEVSLLLDSKLIQSSGWDMKNAKDTINKGATDRCYSFLFQGVTAQTVQSSNNARISIQRLSVGMPEGVTAADFKAEQVEGPWDASIK